MKFTTKKLVEIFNIVTSKFQREFNTKETIMLITHNKPIFWSWGVDIDKIVSFTKGGLLFPVNGHHHKGYVLITLSYDDTYTVTFYNKKFVEVKEIEGVYFDELVNTIDVNVEKIPEYKY